VNRPERRALIVFGIRFVVVFTVLLLPVPWLPDTYVTLMGGATNAMLAIADAGATVSVRFEPPVRIVQEGSWKANLRVEDRQAWRSTSFRLDMRSFSYRPFATFVALTAATSIQGARRRLALWAGGLLCMFVVTNSFAALPLLSRFAIAGAFGELPGLLVRTLYQATATPVMVYLLPLLVWSLLLLLTKPRGMPAGGKVDTPSTASPPSASATNS
jgi:hypothetical protein